MSATTAHQPPIAGKRVGSLGSVIPVALVEPDGLIITTDGRYVRLLECERVPNPISADPTQLAVLERAYRELCRAIPDGQSLSIYSQTDTIADVREALAEDRQRVQAACDHDLARGQEDLALARRRLLAGLTQTVVRAAGAEQPGVAARWWVAVPYRPRASAPREELRQAAARARGRTTWQAHHHAAAHSLALATQIQAALANAGIDAYRLDGVSALAILWERLHPATTIVPDFKRLEQVTRVASAHAPQQARELRHDTLRALCDPAGTGGPTAGIDASDPGWLRHADGTLEEILHLATPPLQTSPWWLSYLLACPLPATLAVHITVGSRAREQARQRRRWKRLRAAVIYKERRGQLVGSDEHDALQEAELVDGELVEEIGATVYKVGVYLAVRDPTANAREFDALVGETARTFHSLTNAKVIRGRRLNLRGFTSTLPLGVDTLNATRSYGQRNIAHCVPLTSSSCGSPTGLIVGTADPGGTLERIDPFDPLFPRRVTLVLGPSGGGKTVLMNALLMRAISQGMRGWIIDRSSTPDQDGRTAGTGHYDALLSLVPGSRRVQVGSGVGDVICPWDVHDPAHVPAEKKEFLLALHALLIGHAEGADRRERTLTAVEEGILSTAIDDVYARAARTGERARETMLFEQLTARAADGGLAGSNADAIQSLLLRLEPYSEGGTLAHIADHATTVPDDAPLTLFDLTGLPERLTPAMVLMLVSHIEQKVQHTRRARVDGELDDAGAWAGKLFLVVEEGWAMTASPAAGSWLNEYARRSRHYALWLLFVTQHFKDLANEQGRALLANSVLRLCLQNDVDDLELGRDTIGLTETDIEQITTLPRRKGDYSTVYMVSPRGRGAVRVALGDLEYWIASSDPEHDQPTRHQALAEAGGDPWKALRLLCTPDWHEHRKGA
jgi:hypothetical protein